MTFISGGENAVRFADFFERRAHFDERGEHGDTGEVGQEAGEERRTVSDEGGDKQHLSRTFADVGNGYGDQSDDNERNGEVKKFTENSVERNEYSYQRSRKNSANGNPQDDSNNDAWQQADLDFLHSDSYLLTTKIVF